VQHYSSPYDTTIGWVKNVSGTDSHNNNNCAKAHLNGGIVSDFVLPVGHFCLLQ